MSISESYLYWLDLETTGLDPEKDHILEVAMVRTAFEEPTAVVDEFHAVLAMPEGYGPERWHPAVREMHTKNGLIDECEAVRARLSKGVLSVDRLAAIEDKLLAFCPKPVDLMFGEAVTEELRERHANDKWTLAGSNVHFDHKFLDEHMPRLAKRFMHRYLCVSSLKVFCRTLGMERPPKAQAHRAMDDIRESMAHMAFCRKWLAAPETAVTGWGSR